jgi:hypothetical protein
MAEAHDRLHETPDRAKTSREITAREIDAMARHIARKGFSKIGGSKATSVMTIPSRNSVRPLMHSFGRSQN